MHYTYLYYVLYLLCGISFKESENCTKINRYIINLIPYYIVHQQYIT